MAYAGLRRNEVRALENRNARLRLKQSRTRLRIPLGPRRRILTANGIRRSASNPNRRAPAGRTHSGHRLARKVSVALTAQGRPWAQSGLHQAFLRACSRANVEGLAVHSLGHHAGFAPECPSTWFERMAGHKHLRDDRALRSFAAWRYSTKPPCALATCWQQRHPPLPLRHLLTQPNAL